MMNASTEHQLKPTFSGQKKGELQKICTGITFEWFNQ